ncbi:MAG: DUF5318 family protein [Actinobacteria bacterium]|nr:DUF5318 family protein [Actinomycetota bacterium]
MVKSGRSFDPTRPPRALTGPTVEYSLARRAVLAALRRGTLGTTEVCDAHPELLRAAKNIGDSMDPACPVCSHSSMRMVRYVYGDALKSNNGRVVYPSEWLKELAVKHEEFTCYVVEVCIDCAWNHLVRAYSAGRRFSAADDARTETTRS